MTAEAETQQLSILSVGTEPWDITKSKNFLKNLEDANLTIDQAIHIFAFITGLKDSDSKGKKYLYKRFDNELKLQENSDSIKVGQFTLKRVTKKSKVITGISEAALHYTEKIEELRADWERERELLIRDAQRKFEDKEEEYQNLIEAGTSGYEETVTKHWSIS